MNELHSLLPTQEQPVDQMLRHFFRAELPDPWPQMDVPETIPIASALVRRPRWLKMGARLALAASIGFILVAYLALAQHFPRHEPSGSGLEQAAPPIGQKPRHVVTPKGRDAIMLEQIIPGDRPDRPTFKFELQVIKGPDGRPAR